MKSVQSSEGAKIFERDLGSRVKNLENLVPGQIKIDPIIFFNNNNFDQVLSKVGCKVGMGGGG